MLEPAPNKPPHGLSEIIAAFGDVRSYIRNDGTLNPDWERHELDLADLPAGIPLSWDPAKIVHRIRCNRVLVPRVEAVFKVIHQEGLWGELREFGGCFAFRPQRGSRARKLSLHCWGAALDLNPSTNQLGTAGDMPLAIVKLFRELGWQWGGLWDRPDPMHFQFATGY